MGEDGTTQDRVDWLMRFRATLATLLVVILLSGSCAASSCGAACALDALQCDHPVGTSASPVAEVKTCPQIHPSMDGTVERNSAAVLVSDAAVCDDCDCDAPPAVVESAERLTNGLHPNPAVLFVFQAADVWPAVDVISLQRPLPQDTSPPSHKTILRV